MLRRARALVPLVPRPITPLPPELKEMIRQEDESVVTPPAPSGPPPSPPPASAATAVVRPRVRHPAGQQPGQQGTDVGHATTTTTAVLPVARVSAAARAASRVSEFVTELPPITSETCRRKRKLLCVMADEKVKETTQEFVTIISPSPPVLSPQAESWTDNTDNDLQLMPRLSPQLPPGVQIEYQQVPPYLMNRLTLAENTNTTTSLTISELPALVSDLDLSEVTEVAMPTTTTGLPDTVGTSSVNPLPPGPTHVETSTADPMGAFFGSLSPFSLSDSSLDTNVTPFSFPPVSMHSPTLFDQTICTSPLAAPFPATTLFLAPSNTTPKFVFSSGSGTEGWSSPSSTEDEPPPPSTTTQSTPPRASTERPNTGCPLHVGGGRQGPRKIDLKMDTMLSLAAGRQGGGRAKKARTTSTAAPAAAAEVSLEGEAEKESTEGSTGFDMLRHISVSPEKERKSKCPCPEHNPKYSIDGVGCHPRRWKKKCVREYRKKNPEKWGALMKYHEKCEKIDEIP